MSGPRIQGRRNIAKNKGDIEKADTMKSIRLSAALVVVAGRSESFSAEEMKLKQLEQEQQQTSQPKK